MNLYADFVSSEGTKVTYRIGYRTDDVTGIVVYDIVTQEVVILSEPIGGDRPLYEIAVRSLFCKYHASFVKGIFPERISREIG